MIPGPQTRVGANLRQACSGSVALTGHDLVPFPLREFRARKRFQDKDFDDSNMSVGLRRRSPSVGDTRKPLRWLAKHHQHVAWVPDGGQVPIPTLTQAARSQVLRSAKLAYWKRH